MTQVLNPKRESDIFGVHVAYETVSLLHALCVHSCWGPHGKIQSEVVGNHTESLSVKESQFAFSDMELVGYCHALQRYGWLWVRHVSHRDKHFLVIPICSRDRVIK